MKPITIFTPTFNRANLLPRLYESLCRQSSQDFIWLVIDDGSTDNTKELVEKWKLENKIEIRYYYKENGGLHTAYNLGIEKADTELFMCIDSDDYAPENVIGKILEFWKRNGGNDYAGIIGLDYTKENKPIGDFLPNQKSIHFLEVKMHYRGVGDCKLVHRTALLKEHIPMPVFKGEKNFNPSYIFLKVDISLPLLVLNENLCFVEYQPEGMSNNILKQYVNSPNSFMELRKLYLTLPRTNKKFKIRHFIHFISSCIFAKRYKDIFSIYNIVITLFFLPLGIILNLYIKLKST